ncbi:hypothetical protein AGRO_4398 [Agrobacterium sp. ATCC 31749]|nr:hypothetical protein AGRO_4398 [Agrobacterium sp. ATCC 31749]
MASGAASPNRRRTRKPAATSSDSENGIMKPIFCLFDIFIPFLVRTSMLSSQPHYKAAHKAVIKGNSRRGAFRTGLPTAISRRLQPHSRP